LIDRLMHRAEVVRIDGDSYRAKEAQEREAQRLAARSAKATPARPRKAGGMSAALTSPAAPAVPKHWTPECEEAAAAQPGGLDAKQVQHWLYLHTVAGQALQAVRAVGLVHADPSVRMAVDRVLIPRAILSRWQCG
jgi:hypothetical protein